MSHSPHPASIECIFGYVIPQGLQEASVQSTEAVPKRGDGPSLEKDGEIVGADCGLVGNDLPLKQLGKPLVAKEIRSNCSPGIRTGRVSASVGVGRGVGREKGGSEGEN